MVAKGQRVDEAKGKAREQQGRVCWKCNMQRGDEIIIVRNNLTTSGIARDRWTLSHCVWAVAFVERISAQVWGGTAARCIATISQPAIRAPAAPVFTWSPSTTT